MSFSWKIPRIQYACCTHTIFRVNTWLRQRKKKKCASTNGSSRSSNPDASILIPLSARLDRLDRGRSPPRVKPEECFRLRQDGHESRPLLGLVVYVLHTPSLTQRPPQQQLTFSPFLICDAPLKRTRLMPTPLRPVP